MLIVSTALPADWLNISWARLPLSMTAPLLVSLVVGHCLTLRRLTRCVIRVKRFFASRHGEGDSVWKPTELKGNRPDGEVQMTTDTLATMFWSRVEKSAGRPAQMFKQGGVWNTLTWREVGDVVREVAL